MPKGQEIAVLNSSFTTHPYVPNYTFEDRRFGRQDGTFVDGAWVKIYGRTDQNAPVQQERVRLEENMVTPARACIRICEITCTTCPIGMLSSRCAPWFCWKVATSCFASTGWTQPANPKQLGSISIEADGWLLRLVAPKLEVRYDRETRRLLSYHGASNLLNADQGVQNVTITYRYSNDGFRERVHLSPTFHAGCRRYAIPSKINPTAIIGSESNWPIVSQSKAT